MADGMEKGHALRTGRSMVQECPLCFGLPAGQHHCAFLAGKFDPANWNCQSFAVLESSASRFAGDELEVFTNESTNGTVLVWFRRVGNPQRVRKALAFGPDFQPLPVTLDLIQSIHAHRA